MAGREIEGRREDKSLTLDQAYDARNLILYASLHQLFRIWIIPGFSAPVRLTTVLHLKKHSQHSQAKYLISSQNDLYQLTEVVLFGSYFRILWGLLIFWQFVATGLCVLGAMVLGPGMTWVEENVIGGNWGKGLADVVGDEGAGEGGILQGEKGVQH
ncbi:MAG: hypothetical protein MMC33_005033 [Icmadophila ericetorum]|nr:hypothetical protein [Icmadophila ericetorum]